MNNNNYYDNNNNLLLGDIKKIKVDKNYELKQNENNNAYMFICHGDRTLYTYKDKRYTLKNDNFYYITYTQFGFFIYAEISYVYKSVIYNNNAEINKLIQLYTDYQIKKKLLKERKSKLSKTQQKKITLLNENNKYYLSYNFFIILFKYYIKIGFSYLIVMSKDYYPNDINIIYTKLIKFIIKIYNEYLPLVNIIELLYNYRFNVILYLAIEYILNTPEYIKTNIESKRTDRKPYKKEDLIYDVLNYITKNISKLLLEIISNEKNNEINALWADKFKNIIKHSLYYDGIIYTDLNNYKNTTKNTDFEFNNFQINFVDMPLFRLIMYHTSFNMKIYNKNQRHNKISIPHINLTFHDHHFYDTKIYHQYKQNIKNNIDKINIKLLNSKPKTNISNRYNNGRNLNNITYQNNRDQYNYSNERNQNIRNQYNYSNERNQYNIRNQYNYSNQNNIINNYTNIHNPDYDNIDLSKLVTKFNKIFKLKEPYLEEHFDKFGIFSLNDENIKEEYRFMNYKNKYTKNKSNYVNIYLLCIVYFIIENVKIYNDSSTEKKKKFNLLFDELKKQLFQSKTNNSKINNILYNINNKLYNIKHFFTIKEFIESIEYTFDIEKKQPIYIHIECCLSHDNENIYTENNKLIINHFKNQQNKIGEATNNENGNSNENNRPQTITQLKLINKNINSITTNIEIIQNNINTINTKDKYNIYDKHKYSDIYLKYVNDLKLNKLKLNILETFKLLENNTLDEDKFYSALYNTISTYLLTIKIINIIQILERYTKLYTFKTKIKQKLINKIYTIYNESKLNTKIHKSSTPRKSTTKHYTKPTKTKKITDSKYKTHRYFNNPTSSKKGISKTYKLNSTKHATFREYKTSDTST